MPAMAGTRLIERTGGTSGWYLFDAEGLHADRLPGGSGGRGIPALPGARYPRGQCMVTDARGSAADRPESTILSGGDTS